MARRASIRRLTAVLFIALAAPCSARAELLGSQLGKIEAAPAPNAQLPLQLELQSEGGDVQPLKQWLDGEPTVWVFADYTCKTLCGPIVSIVSDALRQTGLKPGTDFRFIVIGL